MDIDKLQDRSLYVVCTLNVCIVQIINGWTMRIESVWWTYHRREREIPPRPVMVAVVGLLVLRIPVQSVDAVVAEGSRQ